MCHGLTALPSFSTPQPSSFHTGVPPNEILEHFVVSQHLLRRGCGLTHKWITVPSHHAYSKQGLEDLVECVASGSDTSAGNSGARGVLSNPRSRQAGDCRSVLPRADPGQENAVLHPCKVPRRDEDTTCPRRPSSFQLLRYRLNPRGELGGHR